MPLDAAPHDPGGKVRLRLPAGMRGEAVFCDEEGCLGDTHRPFLTRSWGLEGAPFALFVGMNPSTAAAEVNDPTVAREVGFAQRWGLTSYAKANVMDLRATNPRRLLAAGAVPRSEANLRTIRLAAREAERVVLAFGTLPRQLRPYAEETVAELRKIGVALLCLGITADGSPRHPLYLRSDSPLIPWEGFRV